MSNSATVLLYDPLVVASFISSLSNTRRLKPKVGRMKRENGFAKVMRKAGPIPKPMLQPEPDVDVLSPSFGLASSLLKKSTFKKRLKPASNLLSLWPK